MHLCRSLNIFKVNIEHAFYGNDFEPNELLTFAKNEMSKFAKHIIYTFIPNYILRIQLLYKIGT